MVIWYASFLRSGSSMAAISRPRLCSYRPVQAPRLRPGLCCHMYAPAAREPLRQGCAAPPCAFLLTFRSFSASFSSQQLSPLSHVLLYPYEGFRALAINTSILSDRRLFNFAVIIDVKVFILHRCQLLLQIDSLQLHLDQPRKQTRPYSHFSASILFLFLPHVSGPKLHGRHPCSLQVARVTASNGDTPRPSYPLSPTILSVSTSNVGA